MTPRHLAAASLVAALALAGTSCGDDPEPTDDPTTVTTTSTSTTTTTTVDGTTPPTDAEAPGDDATTGSTAPDDGTTAPATPFAEGAAQVRTMLDRATTACDLVAISEFTATLAEPTGPAEVRRMVELQAELFVAIADTAPAQFAAQADVVRRVAGSLVAEAEAVGFDLAAVRALPSLLSDEFQTAFFSFYEDTADNC